MRRIVNLNSEWTFIKEDVGAEQAATYAGLPVELPHTWNALDGQDGGDDYYRGRCYYVKKLKAPSFNEGEQVYLEFNGVNSSAAVTVNGEQLYSHDGGYSTFRVNITATLKEQNTIVVAVDNAENDRVYPQKADFTFYGGIYRDVKLIIVSKAHFDLDYYGSCGVKITPEVVQSDDLPAAGKRALVTIDAWMKGVGAGEVKIKIIGEDEPVCKVVPIEAGSQHVTALMEIIQPHLWHGCKDPFLYNATVTLLEEGEVVDEVTLTFGCRSFSVDSERGFFLNGEPYPLRGVSRHQDREQVGNALTPTMHEEDMKLIAGMGANSIRLAHYQHDQDFYDLCDKYGMVVWAEIPYITKHMDNGLENTLSQMRELIVQNYHHVSVCFWGISNEVTAGGLEAGVIENNRMLESLVKELDTTRLSTMACAFTLDENSAMLELTDTIAYNHYFGWYMGEVEDNDEWFDTFHKNHPGLSLGLSEYGAEAVMQWQTSHPERGDYTEQYQARYHEHMLEMIDVRPYLWCSYVWNMFDFAADARDEGGVRGRNNKGLVTFDRKIKKDAYYIYKAYWSAEPFVYITGRRYINRAEKVSTIKVYSNQDFVKLYHNGQPVELSDSRKHIFYFEVELEEQNELSAQAGEETDNIIINKVDEPDLTYVLPVLGNVTNWLDDVTGDGQEGYFTLEDKVGELVKIAEGNVVFRAFMASYDKRKQGVAASVQMTEEQRMMTMRSMKLKELIRRTNTPAEEVKEFLARLQKIKKEKV